MTLCLRFAVGFISCTVSDVYAEFPAIDSDE